MSHRLADRIERLFRLFTEIGIIDQLATAAVEPRLPAGLTLAQFGVLNHFVRMGGGWSPGRLARAFQVTRQTMTSTLARMARAGLVEIVDNPVDGRSKLVSLTSFGQEMHARCRAAMAPTLADLAGQLPDDLVEQLLPLLSQLRARLDSARD